LEEIENEIHDNLIKLDLSGSEAISRASILKIGLNLSLIYICLIVQKGDQVNGKNIEMKLEGLILLLNTYCELIHIRFQTCFQDGTKLNLIYTCVIVTRIILSSAAIFQSMCFFDHIG